MTETKAEVETPQEKPEGVAPAMKSWMQRIAANPATVDPQLTLGRRFWLDDDMFETDPKTGQLIPSFSVKETGLLAFGKSPDWVRWRSMPAKGHPDGYFVLDEHDPENRVKLEPRRTEHSARWYSLADIEKMAHALLQNGAIDAEYFTCVIMIVKWRARLAGVDID